MSEAAFKEMLLVEDNSADVYLTREAVADCSKEIHVWCTGNGLEALAFLRKHPPCEHVPSPALILLDLNLPKLDGLEVLRALRQMPAYQETPVVIFSSADRDFSEKWCLQAGANEFVQKPSDLDGFFTTIRDIVCKWMAPEGA